MPQHNPGYIHHQKSSIATSLREVVFGIEDGMVSTMGAVTGIAVGSGDYTVVVLAGAVIIAVESISMGVGSYLSSKSEREVNDRMVEEEREEIDAYPKEEKKEMVGLFVADGWSPTLAARMAEEAAKNNDLMLREMSYRELKIIPSEHATPVKNGAFMFGSYVLGGLVPLIPYLFFEDISRTIPLSIGMTLAGLFGLGAATTALSKRVWWKAGFEMFLLAGLAALAGYVVGRLFGV